MTANRTAMTADHSDCRLSDCSFREIQDERRQKREDTEKSGGSLRADDLYKWCKDEMCGERLVGACRAHVENSTWCEHGEQLIGTWDKDDPESKLQDLRDRSYYNFSEHHLFMTWAHLRIAKAWAEEGGGPDRVSEKLFGDVSERRWGEAPFGRSFFRALARFLSPEQSLTENQPGESTGSAEASARFPLILDEPDEARVAQIRVQDSGRGYGDVFLHPEQAFLNLDDDFRSAFASAQELVEGLVSDAYVRIELPQKREWEKLPVLSGKSAGGALYLSLRSLAEKESLEKRVVTSFALDDRNGSPEGQCRAVGHIQEKGAELPVQNEADRFLISERQPEKEKLEERLPGLEVLRARTVEEAWYHATGRLAEMRRYLKHVVGMEAEETAVMGQPMPHVRARVQAARHSRDTPEEPVPDRGTGRLDQGDIVSDSPPFGELERGVILGDPGMGKTRLLKGEAKALAERALGDLEDDGQLEKLTVPIYLQLDNVAELIAEEGFSLREAVKEQFSRKEIRPVGQTGSADTPPESLVELVEKKVGTDKVWVLLDALDEVPDENDRRSEIASEIIDFTRNNPNSRLLLTSRTASYDSALSIGREETEVELELQPFREEQIESFAEEYFSGEKAKKFLSELNACSLKDIAEVPLFLSFLCMIYEEEGLSGFDSRADVCEKILLGILSAGEGESQGSRIGSRPKIDKRLDEFSAIAFSLKAQGKLKFTTRSLRSAVEFGYRKENSERTPDEGEKKDLLEDLSEVLAGPGLRDKSFPRSDEIEYQFIHRTIHEYLSARWLSNKVDDEDKGLKAKVEDGDGNEREASIFMSPNNLGQEHVLLSSQRLEDMDPLLELLSDQLKSDKKYERENAVKTLERIGNSDPLVLESMVPRLKDENWSVRRAAIEALGEIITPDQLGFQVEGTSVREALVNRLDDNRWSVREAAAKAIGKVGLSESGAVELLSDRLSDSEWPVRRAAAKALGKVRTSSRKAIDRLVGQLGDEQESVRKEARKSLEQIKEIAPKRVKRAVVDSLPASGSAAAFIAGLLRDDGMRHAAAKALERAATPVQGSVVQRLANRLGDDTEGTRKSAVQGLKEIITSAPGVIETLGSESAEALRNQLDDEAPSSVHRVAALAVTLIRDPEMKVAQDSEVVKGVVDCLKDVSLRQKAAEGLGRIETHNSKAVGALTHWLENGGSDMRETVAGALGQIGDSCDSVVDGLVARLGKDESVAVREASARALRQIGASGPSVVSALSSRREDESQGVQKEAARTLGEIERIDVLTDDWLVDESEDVRTAAADSLWRYGREGKRALIEHLYGEALRVQRTAERTLRSNINMENTESVLIDWLESAEADVLESVSQAPKKLVRLLSEPEVTEIFADRLGNRDAHVREATARAIEGMKISDPEAVMTLISRIENGPRPEEGASIVRKAAKAAEKALQRIEELSRGKLEHLLADHLCTGGSGELLIEYLESGGNASRRVAEAFDERFQEYNWDSRRAAIRALSETGASDSQVAKDLLINGLQDEHPRVRKAAARGFGAIEAKVSNSRTVAALMDRLDDRSAGSAAMEALAKIEISDSGVARSLTDRFVNERQSGSIDDNSTHQKKAAIRALEGMSVSDPQVVRALIDQVENEQLGDIALSALENVDVSHPKILRYCIDLLKERDSPSKRKAAAHSLGKKKAPHPEVIGTLACRLEDRHDGVRAAVVEALEKIKTSNSEGIEDFANWLKTQHPFMQEVVERALAREDAFRLEDFNLDRADRVSR